MKTIKIIFLSALLISISACDSLNSNAIALVDLDAVAKALGRDEVMKQEIAESEQQLQQQLTAIAGELQNKVKQEQASLTEKSSDEDKQRVQQLIVQAQQQLRNEQLAAQQKSNQLKADLINKFRDEVKAIAEPLAKASGVQMVKVIRDDVLWFDAEADMTDEVIAKMRSDKN
ncbi:MAG: OmpH family outer membrane protein [Gammaproteobacteria bacterium]|nr:OmpH family outer membrane protein [Gammaproteobacteria bacterium]